MNIRSGHVIEILNLFGRPCCMILCMDYTNTNR